jgi:Zn-dependent membrane protease YugP
MYVLIIILLVLLLFFAPHWWVQSVMKRYSTAREDFPGSGGEFANHLINRLSLSGVGVEATEKGDHYDPEDKMVRLTNEKYTGHSLTAIVVAAHEVSHALQDAQGYRPLRWRHHWIKLAIIAQQAGNAFIIGIPLITIISRTPSAGFIFLLAGLASMGSAALVHLLTLPVELDASFKRALPILEKGGYLQDEDLNAAHAILRAAAFTYVAASLAGLLNLWRWIRVLKR